MEKQERLEATVCREIGARTGGEILIGVVGPVRTGKSTLIKQFMALQTNGIIATHDLLLGSLITLFPDDIRNYCFEADITNDELTFAYRLRSGVAQNMNACFLMKKMGIAVAD